MSEILYNFGANNASLEDINSNINSIQEVRQDIDSVLRTLMSVNEGEGATALNQAHVQMSGMLDDALNNTANTQKKAQKQQELMQAVDPPTPPPCDVTNDAGARGRLNAGQGLSTPQH